MIIKTKRQRIAAVPVGNPAYGPAVQVACHILGSDWNKQVPGIPGTWEPHIEEDPRQHCIIFNGRELSEPETQALRFLGAKVLGALLGAPDLDYTPGRADTWP